MPRLWRDTVDAHRRAVQDAALDATAALVAEHGLAAVTMSQIAQATGIGRATLYKYFPDVEAILMAWHERHVHDHLARLVEVRDQVADPGGRLRAALEAYALLSHQRPAGGELAALLHGGDHVRGAEHQLVGFVEGLLRDAVASGEVRDDIAAPELAQFCLHALTAAGDLRSAAAVRRLVQVTMNGLRPDWSDKAREESDTASSLRRRSRPKR